MRNIVLFADSGKRFLFWVLPLLVSVFTFPLIHGCNQTEPGGMTADVGNSNLIEERIVYFNSIIVLWHLERKDEALRVFLSEDPKAAPAVEISRVLTIREAEVASLDQAEVAEMQKQGAEFAQEIVQLARAVRTAATEDAIQGNEDRTKRTISKLREMGEMLQLEYYPAIINLAGSKVVELTSE